MLGSNVILLSLSLCAYFFRLHSLHVYDLMEALARNRFIWVGRMWFDCSYLSFICSSHLGCGHIRFPRFTTHCVYWAIVFVLSRDQTKSEQHIKGNDIFEPSTFRTAHTDVCRYVYACDCDCDCAYVWAFVWKRFPFGYICCGRTVLHNRFVGYTAAVLRFWLALFVDMASGFLMVVSCEWVP